MDQRQLAGLVLFALMALGLVAFVAFWKGSGLDGPRVAGWRRWRRRWRNWRN